MLEIKIVVRFEEVRGDSDREGSQGCFSGACDILFLDLVKVTWMGFHF